MNDEFAFIKKITPQRASQRSIVVGIGDDAAVFQSEKGLHEVICVDTLVEGVHFRRDTLTPFQVGYKALAVNISDLAAMGAFPTYYLVSLAIPNRWQEKDVLALYEGMNELGKRYSLDLIGGDTVATNDRLVITVTALGRVEIGKQFQRSTAKHHDVLFVTGTVGNSAAGLHLLVKKGLHGRFTEDEKTFVLAHQQPMPQVEFARMLVEQNFRVTLNDVSDGLASELAEIAKASEVTIELHIEDIPFSPGMKMFLLEQRIDWALYGGEDFQLVGTIAPNDWERLEEQARLLGVQVKKIGVVKKGAGKVVLIDRHSATELKRFGYNHFRK